MLSCQQMTYPKIKTVSTDFSHFQKIWNQSILPGDLFSSYRLFSGIGHQVQKGE